MIQRSLRRLPFLLFVCALLALPAGATTYVVNSADDTIDVDGVITLREAMTAASTNAAVGDAAAGAPGLDTITFNIPGSGVRTIAVGSHLPLIVDPVVIDGWSQPGAIPGTPLIALQGTTDIHTILEVAAPGSGSTIRGLAIDGLRTGIILRSSNNTVQGNYIGVGATGTVLTGNPDFGNSGLFIFGLTGEAASNNLIGGAAPGERNVIAAPGAAVDVVSQLGGTADGNRVIGNRLNTNAAGTALLATGDSESVVIDGATNTLIGGSAGTTPGGACTGSCNLAGSAIAVTGSPAMGTIIAGNFVGTDVTGTHALTGAGSAGVFLFNGEVGPLGSLLIGGVTPGARNVIVGRDRPAIWTPNGVPGLALTIQGNYIGIDTTGTRSLGGEEGIELFRMSGVLIGGTAPSSGNVISGQSIYNVSISDSSGTVVQGNIIGPAADGVTSLNVPTNRGVSVEGLSSSNIIGAATAGAAGGNVIAYARQGVRVLEPAVGTTIFGNSMFEISRLGIDLNGDGPSANDACDTDGSANLTQNFPVLSGATESGGVFSVSGTLNSAANGTYRLEFFATPAGTIGPARTPVGTVIVTTDANCAGSFTVPITLPPGMTLTATATDAAGNTSEFSAALVAGAAIPTLSPIMLLVIGMILAGVGSLAIHRM